jgi:hypothetical protein
MTTGEIIEKFRFYSMASADEYSDTSIISHFNQKRREMLFRILRAQGYSSDGIDTLYLDLKNHLSLTRGEVGYDGEYPFDLSIMKVNNVLVKLSPTAEYIEAPIYRQTDKIHADEFGVSTSAPYVILRRNSIFIYPKPVHNVHDGLKVTAALNDGQFLNAASNQVSYGDIAAKDDEDMVLDRAFHEYYPLILTQEYALRATEKINPRIDEKLAVLNEDIDGHYKVKTNTPLTLENRINHSFA